MTFLAFLAGIVVGCILTLVSLVAYAVMAFRAERDG
jgi:hypothetical protein